MESLSNLFKQVRDAAQTRLASAETSPPTPGECPVCQGQGWLKQADGRLLPCECVQPILRADWPRRAWNYSELSPAMTQSFEMAPLGVCLQEEAFSAAVAMARNEPCPLWLTLGGPPGTGKTYLAVAIVRYRMQFEPSLWGKFVDVPSLLNELRAGYEAEERAKREGEVWWADYHDRMESYQKAPLLAIDDLGTEQATPWARTQLDLLINTRYREGRRTVITTNLSGERIRGLGYDRVADRMSDTGRGMVKITLSGPSLRRGTT